MLNFGSLCVSRVDVSSQGQTKAFAHTRLDGATPAFLAPAKMQVIMRWRAKRPAFAARLAQDRRLVADVRDTIMASVV